MAIDPKIIEMINAEIDGEISAADLRELEKALAVNAEARLFREEVSRICKSMDADDMLEAPSHLSHAILAATESRSRKRNNSRGRGTLVKWFSVPALRLAGAFAAGIILTLSFASSDRIYRGAFHDVTDLVGTIADPPSAPSDRHSLQISRTDVAGLIVAHRSGQILVIDFDLVSRGPVDIVASFADKGIWFNGFAQLESTGTSVAAVPGRVILSMEGKRRYALYLRDDGNKESSIDLQFVSSGTIVHEARLTIGTEK